VNSEAYDQYLLARQRIYERSRPTLEAAADLLDNAIALDPSYAPAYAQRGITALLLSEDSYGILPEEQSQTQAKLYLDQALRLDPQQPEALAGLGLYYNNIPGKTTESIETLEKALSINPSLINASNWLQVAYGNAGRLVEQMKILEQMAERDPLYRPGIHNLHGFHIWRMELDKAQATIDRIRPFMPNDPLVYSLEARMLYAGGDAARGLNLMEKAVELRPESMALKAERGVGLLMTSQYERLFEDGIPWQRIVALYYLGRMEEANILAWEFANSGENVGMLISLLINQDKSKEAVRFFEERWDSLDAYMAEFPDEGAGTLMDIAFSYSSIGNAERFDKAMSLARTVLDARYDFGVRDRFHTFNEAIYFIMMGERERALVLLSAAVDAGLLVGRKFSEGWVAMKEMDGDPEYEAIQARMFEHLNAERAELGLAPVNT
jgi:tetratricopeptide (TPR) repeat protein